MNGAAADLAARCRELDALRELSNGPDLGFRSLPMAEKLNLKTIAGCSHCDLIAVGSRPAGITTGLYTAREGMDMLIIEHAAVGDQVATTQWLENVPGFVDGITGHAHSDKLRWCEIRQQYCARTGDSISSVTSLFVTRTICRALSRA